MVLTHPFHCPTKVIEGVGYIEALTQLIDQRSWALITSNGWVQKGVTTTLSDKIGRLEAVLADVESNPGTGTVQKLSKMIPDVDVIVALGGGSVIDAAKGAVSLHGIDGNFDVFMEHLMQGSALPDTIHPLPLIAVPTTSGTGSEVTRWGTIWGDDSIKYSVNNPRLYPTHAVLDPNLCTSMPPELTLATALDSISHAMEAVWNNHHNGIADGLAVQAISIVYKNLLPVLRNPADVELRGRLQTGAVVAGLAMGSTQTALAHSISYPFTARLGIPHGLACSFTLAEIARFNLEADCERLIPISLGLGCSVEDIPITINTWFDELDLASTMKKYVDANAADQFGDDLINRSRAGNNIREADGAIARTIVKDALARIFRL